MRTRRIWNVCLAGLAACLFSVAVAPPAQAQGFGERLGQQLDEGLNRLSSEVREGWASLRQSLDKMGVQGRVYSRLRWDKQLEGAELDLETPTEGEVVLRGRVTSPEAKRKAEQLASDTVGVNRVVNELQVVSPDTPQATRTGQ